MHAHDSSYGACRSCISLRAIAGLLIVLAALFAIAFIAYSAGFGGGLGQMGHPKPPTITPTITPIRFVSPVYLWSLEMCKNCLL